MTRAPILLILAAVPCLAAELKPEAVQAYDRYIHDTEARLAAAKPFLWVDASPERLRIVRQGRVAAVPWKADGDTDVSTLIDVVYEDIRQAAQDGLRGAGSAERLSRSMRRVTIRIIPDGRREP